eukprot:CAMPEP_0196782596 /NCGR_PEP_ID=MMETSP1104-20130614/11678_1 /TAXON_ID=33652 /ORGANISM="Cafeteria sp., Strain Caron Lab Isolate" /LENGTH=73 /DNA_ID=CAMNT_0042152835 /DNA_START=11 /DNA_END=232 /DNA_ORIENTATION=+
MSYWRAAGITFGQYLQITGGAVRNCLKQPLKDQVASRGAVHFRERFYSGTALKQTKIVNSFEHSPVGFAKPKE